MPRNPWRPADVHDVAWSPGGTRLASASVDGSIMIWAVPQQGSGALSLIRTPLHTLTHHQGWVRSVAWDPVGTYFASFGDDKQVVVWRTSDWSVEAQVRTHRCAALACCPCSMAGMMAVVMLTTTRPRLSVPCGVAL